LGLLTRYDPFLAGLLTSRWLNLAVSGEVISGDVEDDPLGSANVIFVLGVDGLSVSVDSEAAVVVGTMTDDVVDTNCCFEGLLLVMNAVIAASVKHAPRRTRIN